MRSRLLFGVCLLAGLAAPARAQDTVESVSNTFAVNTLKAMECRFSVQKTHISIELNDRKFNLRRLDGGARVLLQATPRSQPALATVNRYNAQIAVTTRAVRYQKEGVVLEAGLDCSLGITKAGLEKFVTRFSNQIGDFEDFIAKSQDKDPDPPIAKKGVKQKVPMQIAADKDEKELMITFPTSDPENWETAWKIVWDMESAKQASELGYKFGNSGRTVLFKIKQAYFKPGRNAEWIQVLENAHPQEFYVPYYFRNTRFYDLRDVGGYVKLSPKEGGAVSQVLSKGKQVIAELRDTGTAFKHGNITRRGEELTLFANFAAANYTYMIEYGFRDDGGIVFRHSPTGYNFFPHFDASHMHGSFWHVGMKLGPVGNNTVNQVYSVSLPRDPKLQGDKGKLAIEEITTEKFVDWHPEEFTRIRVSNPNYSIVPEGKDRPALPISYDLVTYPQGIARHRRFADEAFTLHDFWITRHDCPEKMYTQLGNHFNPKNGKKHQPADLDKQNVTIWHSSAGLHTPRAEDGIMNGNGTANGQATIYWTVFELRPRNLFLKTPIYRSLP